MSKAPKVSKEGLAAFLASKPKGPDSLTALYFRTHSLIDEMNAGNLPPEVVVLESIASTHRALEGGRENSEIIQALPVHSWREKTVTIPSDWLQKIAERWWKYRNSPSGTTLGEAFGIEGGGQGRKPAKQVVKRLNRQTHIANRVMVYWLAGNIEGNVTQNEAVGAIAEELGVSFETVKQAWQARRPQILERLTAIGVIEELAG